MRKYLLFITVIVLAFAACHGPEKSKSPVKKAVKKSTAQKQVPFTLHDPSNFPADTAYPAYILTTGAISHNEEVDPKYASHKWIGVFKVDSGYVVKATEVSIIKAHDSIMDEDKSAKTGWEVTSSVKDSTVLLISGIDYVKPAAVPTIKLKTQTITPGKSESFVCNGINYTLHATGKTIVLNGNPDNVANYKLYLKASINGVGYNQEIVSISSFDDAMVTVLFVGDIDGDGRADLILDTTNHYNIERPTLYLSKPAKGKHLVEVVGMHTYTGC